MKCNREQKHETKWQYNTVLAVLASCCLIGVKGLDIAGRIWEVGTCVPVSLLIFYRNAGSDVLSPKLWLCLRAFPPTS